jgi:hypothetical protein
VWKFVHSFSGERLAVKFQARSVRSDTLRIKIMW